MRSSEALPYTALRPRVSCLIRLNRGMKKCVWRPRKRTSLQAEGEEEGEEEEEESMAIVTGEKSILLWTASPSQDEQDQDEHEEQIKPGTMEGIGVPSKAPFEVHDLDWSEDGSCMVLSGLDKFTLAYPLPKSPLS